MLNGQMRGEGEKASRYFLCVYATGGDGDPFEKLISPQLKRARDEGGCYISIRDSTHEWTVT